MPPIINFGSPVQRSKNEKESLWQVPVVIYPRILRKIGPATLPGCFFYLDAYEGDKCTNRILLSVGDVAFSNPTPLGNLIAGEVALVPIAWRSEEIGEKCGFIADRRFFEKKERAYPLPPDRKKRRYRLRVKSGRWERQSPHFYLLRVPESASNGHFVLEIEYEGAGSQ